MYHRFPPRSELRAQCEHLTRYYRPVPLGDVGRWLRGGPKIPAQAVVFTVDDGYRDFYLTAFPILAEYRIPAIVYLATDMLDQRTCLWVDWVKVLYRACPQDTVAFELPQRGPVRFTLRSPEERMQAAWQTKEALKLVPNQERLAFLGNLPALLGLSGLPDCPEEYAPLAWDEVREMAKAGIEFGAHTKSHPILSRLTADSQVVDEIAGSKLRIEQEIGKPVEHFCYPNGHRADVSAATLSAVRQSGFQTAVLAEKGLNFQGADPFQLARIHQEPTTPALRFAHQVAGLTR